MLLGCSAGFLNVPRIKGTHTAMASGMLAAEAAFNAVAEQKPRRVAGQTKALDVSRYDRAVRNSWIFDELERVRNIRPFFNYGLWPGLLHAAVDTYLLRGKAPWTFQHG